MKVFVAVFTILVGVNALTEEQMKKADAHTKFCAEQVGIEYDNAAKFRYAVIADDVEANQCFSKCFFERSGFLNDEGVWQKDVISAVLGFEKDDEAKAKLAQLIEKCTVLTGDNLCNTSFKVHNCYWSHINPAPASE